MFQAQKDPESPETEVFQDQPSGQSPLEGMEILGLGKDKRSQVSKPAEGAFTCRDGNSVFFASLKIHF